MNRIFQFLSRRRRAYAAIFNSPSGRIVLEDLAKFCRSSGSVFHENQRLTDVMIGRREVFDRIRDHLHLSDQELYDILTESVTKPTTAKQAETEDEDV